MNLHSIEPPYFHLVVGSGAHFGKFSYTLNYETTHGPLPQPAVRIVRGKKMKSRAGLFDEFAAAFQFPDYFGENWAALEECLDDLEWLPADGYVMLVSDAPNLLSEEDPQDRTTLLRLLARVCKHWQTEHRIFPSRQLNLHPFHIVFHGAESQVEILLEILSPSSPGLRPIPLSAIDPAGGA